jgi:ATP-dependent helicase HrpB
MSATLDGQRVAHLLGGCPAVRAEGRMHPVETRWLERPPQGRFEDEMASLIRRALALEEGSLLAFLPGEAEIRRVEKLLHERGLPADCEVLPLYGALPPEAQDKALRPMQEGKRKAVLATTIAETSLTIEGVRLVVDGGLKRAARFDPGSGMTRLATVRVSRASAEQRRGRAGRLEPGICWRLWTEPEERSLAAFDAPEIAEADLAPLALDLAEWGVTDPSKLAWLDPPPGGAWAQAVELLRDLEALDGKGRATPLGKRMAALPVHPRLAHMILRADEQGLAGTACDLAALLSERDIVSGGRDCDLRLRLELIENRQSGVAGGLRLHKGALERVRQAARQLRRRVKAADETADPQAAGILAALAYPDRIAQRRGGRGLYRLSGGRGGKLDEADPLAGEEFLAVAELDGAERDARIFLAAPLQKAEIEAMFEGQITQASSIEWDGREGAVLSRRRRLLGALILEDKPLASPDPAQQAAAMAEGVRRLGLAALPWTKAAHSLCDRVRLAARLFPEEGWPDWSDAALLENVQTWLGPWLSGMTRKGDLARLDLLAALEAALDWQKKKRLDKLAPTHLDVPSGSRIALDYGAEEGPVLAVKLQEVFGLIETPKVMEGRAPVVLHLLSPAQRPLAVTRDLASFWANAYPQVKGEMKGRYPRHPWPDDPLAANPTRRLKPKGH